MGFAKSMELDVGRFGVTDEAAGDFNEKLPTIRNIVSRNENETKKFMTNISRQSIIRGGSSKR